MINVGVLGSTGYTGIELIRLLKQHPGVKLVFAASESQAGEDLAAVIPGAPGIRLVAPQEARLDKIDVIFLCLGHGAAAPAAQAALASGVRVIDLSADFRLRDADVYRRWYDCDHSAPELLREAVYGLTEIARGDLRDARLVANPGCYPTSVLLALKPLLEADVVDGTIIVDSKSGVSGAGRKPTQTTHFVEVADNLKPYSIGRVHRHLPEMEQVLGWWSDTPTKVIFSPHLIPVPRGLLSTIYIPVRPGWSEASLHDLCARFYASEPFIQVLSAGVNATLGHVIRSNICALGLTLSDDVLIITSAIDNLLKGASGQALQNMNVMFGLEETLGLL